MPKVTGPLLSLDARQSIGKTLTFQNRRGVSVVYGYKKPGDVTPLVLSTDQELQREKFSAIVWKWQQLTAGEKETWNQSAIDKGFVGTGYHLFVHTYGGVGKGWYNGFKYRKEATIPKAQILESQTDFRTLIAIIDTDLQTKCLASGNDIIFTDSDQVTALKYNIESFDQATGTLIAWVKIPSLPVGEDYKIYMYYDNPSAGNTQDIENTMQSECKALYPFKEGSELLDATVNNNDLTAIGVPVQGTPRWGTGCAGYGAAQGHSAVNHADFRPAGNWSVSASIRTKKTGTSQGICQSWSQNINHAGFYFTIISTNHLYIISGKNTGTTGHTDYEYFEGTINVCDGLQHDVVATYDGAKLHIYIDGVEDGTGKAWTNACGFAATNYVRVGNLSNAGATEVPFQGILADVTFYPANALSLAEAQALHTSRITDAANSAILAKAKALYCFEDGYQLIDSITGNAHPLTAIGIPTTVTKKVAGSVFLGNSSAYSAADVTMLKPTGVFTIKGVMKTVKTASWQHIFASYSENLNEAGMYFIIGGSSTMLNKAFFVTAQNPTTKSIIGGTIVTDGVWHYVVGVWDGLYLRLYVDGLSDAVAVACAVAPVYAATNYVRVGCGCNTGTNVNFMQGQLDEVALLNGEAESANKVLMEYKNMFFASTFMTFGEEI